MRRKARSLPLGGVLVQVVTLVVALPLLGMLIGRLTWVRSTGWRVERMQAEIQRMDERINQGRAHGLLRVDGDYAERVYVLGGRRLVKDSYARVSAPGALPRKYGLVSREFYGRHDVIARDRFPRTDSVEKVRVYFASDGTVFLWDNFGIMGMPGTKVDRWLGERQNGTHSPLPPPYMILIMFYR